MVSERLAPRPWWRGCFPLGGGGGGMDKGVVAMMVLLDVGTSSVSLLATCAFTIVCVSPTRGGRGSQTKLKLSN